MAIEWFKLTMKHVVGKTKRSCVNLIVVFMGKKKEGGFIQED